MTSVIKNNYKITNYLIHRKNKINSNVQEKKEVNL